MKILNTISSGIHRSLDFASSAPIVQYSAAAALALVCLKSIEYNHNNLLITKKLTGDGRVARKHYDEVQERCSLKKSLPHYTLIAISCFLLGAILTRK